MAVTYQITYANEIGNRYSFRGGYFAYLSELSKAKVMGWEIDEIVYYDGAGKGGFIKKSSVPKSLSGAAGYVKAVTYNNHVTSMIFLYFYLFIFLILFVL